MADATAAYPFLFRWCTAFCFFYFVFNPFFSCSNSAEIPSFSNLTGGTLAFCFGHVFEPHVVLVCIVLCVFLCFFLLDIFYLVFLFLETLAETQTPPS
jgi:hypothetical protein